MKFCSKCGKELLDEAVVCTECGCAVNEELQKESEDIGATIGFCILAALLPIFGLIYWPVKHKTAPKRAKTVGITAIIAWAVNFVINIALIMQML